MGQRPKQILLINKSVLKIKNKIMVAGYFLHPEKQIVDPLKPRIKMRPSDTVGHTPLLKVSEKLYAKFETVNPSGSIKDRIATYIINDAEKNNLIKKGDTIVEATSGNTGIAFAFIGAERGYKVKIIMPANMSEERKQMMRLFGAEIIEVPDGDFDGAIELRDELTAVNGWFNPNQFHNPLNMECHERTTGVEIINQTFRKNFSHGAWHRYRRNANGCSKNVTQGPS